MIRESLEDVEHTHRWQEHPRARLLECLLCGAWRLQEGMPGAAWEGEVFPSTEALLEQLARALHLTTQLLESHQLTAEEAAQCFHNRAVLEHLAQSLQQHGLQTNILAAEPSRT